MRFLSLLFFILIASTLTYSQNNDVNDTTLVHGIQFQLPNILKISNFDGYTFSYRYKKNKTSQYRFGFTSDLWNRNTDETLNNDTTFDNSSSQNFHGTIKFSAQYLKTIMSYNKFSLIIGSGPFVLYHSNSNNTEYASSNITIQTDYSDYGIGLGADLISGVEYHIYNNILISAEYNLTLLWDESTNRKKDIFIDRNSNTQTKIKNRTRTTTTVSIGGNRVLLGITFYF